MARNMVLNAGVVDPASPAGVRVLADSLAREAVVHGGQITDGATAATFPDADTAIACARSLQLAETNLLDDGSAVRFRVGIDATEAGAELLRDLAPPGGIMLSESARGDLDDDKTLRLQSIGTHRIAATGTTVRGYRVMGVGDTPGGLGARRTKLFVGVFVGLMVLFSALVGFSKWLEMHQMADQQEGTTTPTAPSN